jgi:uncharacterized integral membrane protein
VATRSGSKSQSGSTRSGGSTAKGKAATNGTSTTNGTGRRSRTSEAGAVGATARARITSMRSKSRAGTRPKAKTAASSVAEPTVTATDDVMAASNAHRAINPDMPRVAWLRTQLQNLEAKRAERLMKVAQLTLIAIVFITFVIQNSQGVNVHFLLFSLNIRLIWVIFGTGVLGGVAGYLIGRPEKSLRALLPQRERKPARPGRRTSRV